MIWLIAALGTAAAHDVEPAPSPFPIVDGALTSVFFGGIGVGVYYGVRARSVRKDARKFCVERSEGLLCPRSAARYFDQDKAASRNADISFASAAAAIVLLTASETLDRPQRLSVSVGPRSASLTWRLK